MWQETYQDFLDASLLGTEGQLLLGELPRAPFVAQQQWERRKVDLLLSQMLLSHSDLGSWEDAAVTQQSELSQHKEHH